MTINHLNLVVPDVKATAKFFIKHFDFLPQESRVNYVAILKSKDGFVLVISNFPNTTLYDYPKDFHIGFYQNDHQE
jgi:catechol 2,3-dioxygenase-like lactoylglutathione lyase family enzyme